MQKKKYKMSSEQREKNITGRGGVIPGITSLSKKKKKLMRFNEQVETSMLLNRWDDGI